MAKKRDDKGVRLTLLLLLLLLSAGTAFWLWVEQGERPGPTGKVETVVTGDASVQRESAKLNLRPGSALYVGDVLVSQEHTADVRLNGGTTLRMGPVSQVEITQNPPPTYRLRQGALRIETTLTSPSLTVGTPFGILTTPAFELSVTDIGIEGGVFVRVGHVDISDNGNALTVPAGHNLTVDGLLLKTTRNDPVTLEDLVFHKKRVVDTNDVAVLTTHPLRITLMTEPTTRVAHNGINASYQDKKRVRLTAGDTVVTDRGGAQVLVEGWGDVTLDADTALTLVDSVQDKQSATATMRLEQGGTLFHLLSDKHESRTLTLQGGAQEHDIFPGYNQAGGHYAIHQQQQVLTLRQGNVHVGDLDVEAGSIIKTDGLTPEAKVHVLPLTEDAVDLYDGTSAVVHHYGNLPALSFHSSVPDKSPLRLFELARDANFQEVRWAEKVRRGSLIVDVLKTGRHYYWRVDKGHVNSLQLVPQTPPGCTGCAGLNPVTDELSRTMIDFDESMPDLDFTWKPVENAKTYLFRLYRDNHFEAPAFVVNVTNTNATVPGDKLLPGGYIWRVVGYDGEGYLVRAERSHELNVQNLASDALTVLAPAANARVKEAFVVARGQVHGGGSLTCNNRPVSLADEGSFVQELPLRPGTNLLVFAVKEKSGMRQIFTRVVVREAGPVGGSNLRVSEDQ